MFIGCQRACNLDVVALAEQLEGPTVPRVPVSHVGPACRATIGRENTERAPRPVFADETNRRATHKPLAAFARFPKLAFAGTSAPRCCHCMTLHRNYQDAPESSRDSTHVDTARGWSNNGSQEREAWCLIRRADRLSRPILHEPGSLAIYREPRAARHPNQGGRFVLAGREPKRRPRRSQPWRTREHCSRA